MTVWAVPTVPMTFDAFKLEIADPFEMIASPWTLSPVRVPTDVMFGWAVFVTVWAVPTVPMTFDAFKLDRAYPFPVYAFAFRVPATDSDVSCPTDVMFGWAALVTV